MHKRGVKVALTFAIALAAGASVNLECAFADEKVDSQKEVIQQVDIEKKPGHGNGN